MEPVWAREDRSVTTCTPTFWPLWCVKVTYICVYVYFQTFGWKVWMPSRFTRCRVSLSMSLLLYWFPCWYGARLIPSWWLIRLCFIPALYRGLSSLGEVLKYQLGSKMIKNLGCLSLWADQTNLGYRYQGVRLMALSNIYAVHEGWDQYLYLSALEWVRRNCVRSLRTCMIVCVHSNDQVFRHKMVVICRLATIITFINVHVYVAHYCWSCGLQPITYLESSHVITHYAVKCAIILWISKTDNRSIQ